MCYKAPEQIPVIGIGSIKDLNTGSYSAHFLVNFLAIKLIATCNIRHLNSKCPNVIGIGSIKNPSTGSYFCTFFGEFSSNKVDSNM
jgi:hypothetical protein